MNRQDRPSLPEAMALADLGRPTEAVTMLRRLVAAAPHDPVLRCQLAATLLDAKDARGAFDEARTAIRLHPNLASAHLVSGWARLELRWDPSEAVRSAEESLRLEPNNADAFYLLGEACLADGRVGRAAAASREVLARRPDSAASHTLAARVAMNDRRWKDAEQACRRAIALDSTSAADFNNLGVVYLRRFRLIAATRRFATALRLDPRQAVTVLNLTNVRLVFRKLAGAALILTLIAVGSSRAADRVATLSTLATTAAIMIVVGALVRRRWRRSPRWRQSVRLFLARPPGRPRTPAEWWQFVGPRVVWPLAAVMVVFAVINRTPSTPTFSGAATPAEATAPTATTTTTRPSLHISTLVLGFSLQRYAMEPATRVNLARLRFNVSSSISRIEEIFGAAENWADGDELNAHPGVRTALEHALEVLRTVAATDDAEGWNREIDALRRAGDELTRIGTSMRSSP